MARSPDRILDELLVLRCRRGDSTAFERLVRRWHGRLRRHAWHLTQDADATADVVQDAWMEITRGLRRLRDPAAFRGWAFRIVSNHAANWLRRRTRERRVLAKSADEARASEPPVDGTDGASRVRQALQTLPSETRRLLWLRYFDNLSTREIATALDIPLGTVKSRLHHARERLAQAMQRSSS